MVRSSSRWCFGITPYCSPDTHSPLQDVYRENSGEVLPKFYLGEERSMETDLIYASAGGIRTYPHLLDSRNTALMQLMVTILYAVNVKGWRTVSGCTRAGEAGVTTTMNG